MSRTRSWWGIELKEKWCHWLAPWCMQKAVNIYLWDYVLWLLFMARIFNLNVSAIRQNIFTGANMDIRDAKYYKNKFLNYWPGGKRYTGRPRNLCTEIGTKFFPSLKNMLTNKMTGKRRQERRREEVNETWKKNEDRKNSTKMTMTWKFCICSVLQ